MVPELFLHEPYPIFVRHTDTTCINLCNGFTSIKMRPIQVCGDIEL